MQNQPAAMLVILRSGLPMQVVKFCVSGAIALVVQVGLLYALTDFFGLWYMLSFGVAFSIATLVSFTLHKFWTFQDMTTARLHLQTPLYVALALGNMAVNAAALYALVDIFMVWYLLAQVAITLFLALGNFVFYKFFLFKKSS